VTNVVKRFRPEQPAPVQPGSPLEPLASPVQAEIASGLTASTVGTAGIGPGPVAAPARPFWQTNRFRVLALLVLVAIVGVALSMRTSGPVAPVDPAAQTPLVSVTTPGRTPVTGTVTFTGAIAARYDMPIGVEGEGGRIASVRVEPGDRVRRGQVLATLDTSVVGSQVASLRAQLVQAEAEAALAEQDFRRAEAVANSVGALSQQEVDNRRSRVATSRARVEAARAQLAESQARLGRTEIRAPADGLVLTRDAEVGQTATPGSPALFRLARGGEIEMRARVAEQDLPKLRVGQPAQVRVTGLSEAFPGQVRLLGAVIDPQTRLGEVRVQLQPNPNLRPGAFARGEVETGRESRPVLPQTAVLSDGTQNYVLVVGADGKVARRDVRIASTGVRGVVIAEGLDGTERVVTAAGPFLQAGETVRVAETPAAPAGSPAQAAR
jgi:RND family efflux transporter MFP subunit